MLPRRMHRHRDCANPCTTRLQDVCRFLFTSGASSLPAVAAGTGLGRQRCCRVLLALVQHSLVRAHLREELGAAQSLHATTVYQVRLRRFVMLITTCIYVLHVAHRTTACVRPQDMGFFYCHRGAGGCAPRSGVSSVAKSFAG